MFNQQIIDEFRANRGQVGGPFEGGRLILLTTKGAKSGAPHTTPLGFLPDGAERILVIASAGGSPTNPDWYHNLLAEPTATVETGLFTYEAAATVLSGEEHEQAWARAVEVDPGWAEYQAKAGRPIPVVALTAVSYDGPPPGRSFGEALRTIHDGFRRELALVRAEVAASGGATLGAQLRINCLTMCQGLHVHHTKEDEGLFPAMRAQGPHMEPVMDRLDEEHRRIAELLAELERALDGDRETVLAEVTRLTREVERHLDYEEEQLIPILDAAAGH
ncbi:nitroreductase/quinone reductase family protein [Nonomuraea sp. NPDC050328]|uniref:nitroreductase/quinone reductase family protein n=1 Tax=Nonomuraea sp. NPDC050328 TaxID=3364361 RepID=UPI0037B1DCCD